METKICCKCKIEKQLFEYSKSKNKKLGLSDICKVCHSEYRKNHYLANKEKVYIQVRKYREINPEKYLIKNIRTRKTLINSNIPQFIPLHHSYSRKAGRIIESNCSICNNFVYKDKNDLHKRKYCSKECLSKSSENNRYNTIIFPSALTSVPGLPVNIVVHVIVCSIVNWHFNVKKY